MKWIILGTGKSGLGAKAYLESKGEQVFLFDDNVPNLPASLQTKVISNREDPIFEERELRFVVSPGFPPSHPLLMLAKGKNIPVLSEIDLALEHYSGHLIAITGTNGKSTTVMMIGHLLKALQLDYKVGGNIGIAASSLMLDRSPQYLVLELSSYQIEDSRPIKPKVAVLTGIAPDHLLRHGSLKNYLASKWRLFEYQNAHDFAVIESSAFHQAQDSFQFPKPRAEVSLVSSALAKEKTGSLAFRWDHDHLNAYFALMAVSKATGRSFGSLVPLLTKFRGLPYRCEIIGELGPWKIINDSKGTNVDSTIHALSNIQGKITLLLGGLEKGGSFLEILKFKNQINLIVTFGQAASKLNSEFASEIPTRSYKTLAEAMLNIRQFLEELKGDLIFSPACASQDEFTDFEARGFYFTEHVHSALTTLKGGKCYEPITNLEKS